VTASDPEVTSFDRKSPGSGCKSENWRVLYISLPTRLWLAGGSHATGNDVTGPQVTGSDPELTSFDGSHLEVAVGLKLEYTVHFTTYKAVAHRRR